MRPPQKIHHKKNSNVVELQWQNGEVSRLSGDKLRQFCACARCRACGVVGIQLINDNTEVVKLKIMGSTGIQIGFADGHERGIFPWAYLYAIDKNQALAFLDN